MTTPNEELLAAHTWLAENGHNKDQRALASATLAAIQSQAERIKVLEAQLVEIAKVEDVERERDTLRAELEAIAATEPPTKDDAIETARCISSQFEHVADEYIHELLDNYGIFTRPMPAQREPLSDTHIEAGRHQIFNTENPYCPCDSKTMRKAVQWAERVHNIKKATP